MMLTPGLWWLAFWLSRETQQLSIQLSFNRLATECYLILKFFTASRERYTASPLSVHHPSAISSTPNLSCVASLRRNTDYAAISIARNVVLFIKAFVLLFKFLLDG